MKSKYRDLLQVAGFYVLIAIGGYLTFVYSPFVDTIKALLFADITMTVICFAFSLLKKNSSMYDAYWSVIPFYIVLHLVVIFYKDLAIEHWLAFIVVSVWSWRLTLNWVRSWDGFQHEDWRYIKLAADTGDFYPLMNFFGIHLFPTLLVFGGMLPIIYLFQGSMIDGGLLYIGVGISLLGVLMEFVADNQLYVFRNRKLKKPGELLDSGLWGVIRHPNYVGEILFWLGLAIMGLGAGAPIYASAGAVAIILLFVLVSIPMKERRLEESKESYNDYKTKIPMLIPRFW